MLAKKIVYSVIGIIILIIAYPFIMNLFFGDITAVDDKDLMTIEKVVAASDNAFFDLEQAVKAQEFIEDPSLVENSPLTQANKEKIEALQKKYAAQLALLATAAKKKHFVMPPPDVAEAEVTPALKPGLPTSDDKGPILEQIVFLRGVSAFLKLNSAISELSLSKGHIKEALDRAFDGLAIANMMWRDQSGLLVAIIGQALETGHLKFIQKALESNKLDSELAKKYVAQLDAYALPSPGWLAAKMKSEYQLFANWGMTMLFKSSPMHLSSFHKQPNKTKALFAEFIRNELKEPDKPCPVQVETSQYDLKDLNFVTAYFSANSIGNQAFEGFAVHVRSRLPELKRDQCELDRELAKTKALFLTNAP